MGISYGINNQFFWARLNHPETIFFLLVTHACESNVIFDLSLSLGPHASALFKLH